MILLITSPPSFSIAPVVVPLRLEVRPLILIVMVLLLLTPFETVETLDSVVTTIWAGQGGIEADSVRVQVLYRLPAKLTRRVLSSLI